MSWGRLRRAFVRTVRRVTDRVQNEDPDRGGQVLLAAIGIDPADQGLHRHAAPVRSLAKCLPERLLEGHAGPVARDGHRALDDPGAHLTTSARPAYALRGGAGSGPWRRP